MAETPEDRVEDRVIDALDKLALSYEPITIDQAFSDTALFCSRYGYPAERTINTTRSSSRRRRSRSSTAPAPCFPTPGSM
jgi:hypothetical protein